MDGAGTGRTTFEFDNFDAHIDKKENSELRKPLGRESSGSSDTSRDTEILRLRKQVSYLQREVESLKSKNDQLVKLQKGSDGYGEAEMCQEMVEAISRLNMEQ